MPNKPKTIRQRQREERPQEAQEAAQAADRRRGTSASRGYGHAWRKARAGFLSEHPFCAECMRLGKVVAATVVDHIVPHGGDRMLFWDRTNWQALCASCHSRKTAREDGGYDNTKKMPES